MPVATPVATPVAMRAAMRAAVWEGRFAAGRRTYEVAD